MNGELQDEAQEALTLSEAPLSAEEEQEAQALEAVFKVPTAQEQREAREEQAEERAESWATVQAEIDAHREMRAAQELLKPKKRRRRPKRRRIKSKAARRRAKAPGRPWGTGG